MVLQCLVLLALSWSLVLAADNSTNHIYSPGNDQQSAQGDITWRVDDYYTVNWTTSTVQPYTVALWQSLPGTGRANFLRYFYSTINPLPGNHSTSWQCSTYGADLTLSSLFYMELKANDVEIASHSFNITVGPSSSISSSSSTAAATSASTSSILASATSTSSSNSTSNDSGMSKVALGVGLGIGIPLILLAAIWLGFVIYRQSRRKRTPGQSMNPSLDGSWRGDYEMLQNDQLGMPIDPVYEKHAEQGVSEVPAYREPAELPNHSRE